MIFNQILMFFKSFLKVDLIVGSQISQVQHDLKIDWLELNETGKYLLFRDKKMKVILNFSLVI
jgi:intraflagellar transport protein 172